jgi:hypothetical protein
LRKQLNGLSEELGFEVKSELGDLPLDIDKQLTSKGIDELIDFGFGVLGSAAEGTMGCKVSNGAVVEVFLPAACLHQHGDSELGERYAG